MLSSTAAMPRSQRWRRCRRRRPGLDLPADPFFDFIIIIIFLFFLGGGRVELGHKGLRSKCKAEGRLSFRKSA